MIGERGWVLHFEVEGKTQDEVQEQVLAHLDAFWPREADDGWRLDVDLRVDDYEERADGQPPVVTGWRGNVEAQRVKVSSPRDHEPAGGTVGGDTTTTDGMT